MGQDLIEIRPLTESDRAEAGRFLEAEWGGLIVVHGTVFHPAELPGFIARERRERRGRRGQGEGQGDGQGEVTGPLAGLLVYTVAAEPGGPLEIVTLNAVRPHGGTGTALVAHAVAEARRLGCREVRLTTTNDNVDALRFYQRRGFRLAGLRPGAVAGARKIKPGIPENGDHGIPVRDELDLVCPV
jgi:GNAT superfamily N-acetyltransferase